MLLVYIILTLALTVVFLKIKQRKTFNDMRPRNIKENVPMSLDTSHDLYYGRNVFSGNTVTVKDPQVAQHVRNDVTTISYGFPDSSKKS